MVRTKRYQTNSLISCRGRQMDPIDDELKKAHDVLDDYERAHSLVYVEVASEVDRILALTYEELQNLTPQVCAEYAFMLSQYGLYIQTICNKESGNLKWYNHKMVNMVCHQLPQYGDKYTKYEVRLALIARENAAVKSLLSKINLTEQKLERLQFIGSSVKNMADSLNNLQRAKTNYGRQ